MNLFNNVIEYNNNIISNNWIEWNHGLIPNNGIILRNIIRSILSKIGCCMICTALDGCIFLESNMPSQPQHKNCHCKKSYINQSTVYTKISADCDINKFLKYIFSDNSNGKKQLFESWGFTSNNSTNLKYSYEKQAKENFLAGNYILKNTDIFGQRIAIPINLNGKLIYSGWLVTPNGKLKNTTPFGGFYADI